MTNQHAQVKGLVLSSLNDQIITNQYAQLSHTSSLKNCWPLLAEKPAPHVHV